MALYCPSWSVGVCIVGEPLPRIRAACLESRVLARKLNAVYVSRRDVIEDGRRCASLRGVPVYSTSHGKFVYNIPNMERLVKCGA
jgi:hypothetical protein